MRISFENQYLRGGQGDTWMVVRGHCYHSERTVHRPGGLHWQEDRECLFMLFLKESPALPTAKLWLKVYFLFKSTHWASALCLWKFITERKRRQLNASFEPPHSEPSYWRIKILWGLWSQEDQAWNFLPTNCVTLGKFFHHSEPMFPYL